MSAINQISLFRSASTSRPQGLSTFPSGQAGQDPAQALRQLDQDLAAKGVSTDQREAIQSDIQDSINESFSSGQFPPDPKDAAENIKGILEKHGVDADSLLAGRSGSGGPPAGGFNASAAYSSSDSEQTLLDLIKQWTDNLGQDTSSQNSQSLADGLLKGLIGINVDA